MRILVLDSSADERRAVADFVRKAFPEAEIPVEPVLEGLDDAPVVDGAAQGADSSWTLDRDVRAAALFPSENPSPILRFARNGKVMFANRASRDLLVCWGVAEGGFLPEEWQRIVEEALASGQGAFYRVPCGDKVFGLDFVPILDAGYVNVYGRDVTALRAEREVLTTIMENTRAQLAYLDPQFNFVTVNSAYATGSGHSKEQLIGRNHFDLFPNLENQAIFERVRDSGQGVEFRAKPFEFADQPARGTTYWDWTLAPVRDGDGPVKGLVFSLVDVTDRIRAEKLGDALNSIDTNINSALDFSQIVRRVIAEASAALGCDAATLVLRENDRWLLSETYGLLDGFIGQSFTDDEAPYAALTSQARDVHLVEDVRHNPYLSQEVVQAAGVRSFMAVPLTVRNQVTGTLFFTYVTQTSFSEAEVDFARKLAASVSLALENARLIAELEQRVQERTAELQAIFDSLPDAVYVGNETGINRCNQAALDILGCASIEELWDAIPNLAEKIHNRYVETGERIPAEQEPFVRALRGEHAVVEMIQRNLKTGHDVIVRSACAPIIRDDKVIGALAVNTDITERRRMEEELRRSQRLYQTLQDAIPDMVWSTDTNRIVNYVNRQWQQYTGLTPEELNRLGWQVVFHPEDAAKLAEIWAQAAAACRPFEAELRHRRHDGVYRWVWGRAAPLTDDTGQIVQWVGVMTDIEDRKRADEVLRTHDEQLRAYSRRMMDVIENERRAVARELHDEAGQVLTSLKVGIGLLQRDEDCPASFGVRLEELKQTTDGVLDSLRRLAMDLRPGVLDKAGLVPAVRQYADGFRQQTGLDVQFLDLGLGDRHLPADLATNLYRMVQEALTNVARHAHAGQVGIVLQQRDDRIFLVLEDDGSGFDLSEALQKGHLGLVGMRERAEIMGGSLQIETAPGQGTTLYVEVPYEA